METEEEKNKKSLEVLLRATHFYFLGIQMLTLNYLKKFEASPRNFLST
jgi:hypothetical protein